MRKIEKAAKKYREFHLKEPNRLVNIPIVIPRILYPIGFCPQISYNSSKWNKHEQFHQYIHWWENPTLVCVPEEIIDDMDFEFENGFYSDQEIDIGPGRKEVTFLGYAIDFNLTGDDRSKISINPSTVFLKNANPYTDGELERLKDSITFDFNSNPKASKDYVVCSPNGKIVYIITEDGQEVYAFINNKCKVTKHGIEG